MQDIQPLRFSTHTGLRWTPNSSYQFAANTLMLPVAIDELAAAATQLPLGFTDPAKPTLIALTGLRTGQNLFIGGDGQWLGDYLPSVLRSYPFKLLPAAEGKWALGFDHASGLLVESGDGQTFFTAEGRPSDQLQTTLNFLVRLEASLRRSGEAVAILASHDLLEPWPLKVRDNDREMLVEGLLRISEEKLAKLDDATFAMLRPNGVLALAYAQLLSMANIAKLGKLARRHAQHAAQAQKHQEAVKSMFVPPEPEDEIDWAAMLAGDDHS